MSMECSVSISQCKGSEIVSHRVVQLLWKALYVKSPVTWIIEGRVGCKCVCVWTGVCISTIKG